MDRVKKTFVLSRGGRKRKREREAVADKASRPGRKTGRGETRRFVKGGSARKRHGVRARVLGHSRLATGPVGPL